MWINFWCSKPSVFVEVETWVFPPHHMCDIRCFTGECVNNEGHSLTSMLSQQPLEVKVTGFEGIWSYWWWFWNPKANHLGCMKLWNPVNNGIFTISTGVGFLLSTVVWHQFSHRLVRYYWCNICMHIFIFISISISIFIFIFIYIYICMPAVSEQDSMSRKWKKNGYMYAFLGNKIYFNHNSYPYTHSCGWFIPSSGTITHRSPLLATKNAWEFTDKNKTTDHQLFDDSCFSRARNARKHEDWLSIAEARSSFYFSICGKLHACGHGDIQRDSCRLCHLETNNWRRLKQ